MHAFWRFASWFTRLLLLAATSLFALISWKYLTDPVGNAAVDEITLRSVMAVSRIRVAFGGFPLAFAIILFGCLVSTRRLLIGLVVLAVMIGIVTTVRLMGIMLDGSAAEAVKLLRVEAIVLALSITGIFLELRRRRHQPEAEPAEPSGAGHK